MRVISREWLASKAADRWMRQYRDFGCPIKFDIGVALIGLGSNPDPDKVDEAIGNKSWTRITCDQCQSEISKGVEVGQPMTYDSSTATLCGPCLRSSLTLLLHSSEQE